MKKMTLKEFYELGFIQEINRRLLHPCGLALAVDVEDDGEVSFGCIYDETEDPDGWIFGEDINLTPKFESVEKMFLAKKEHREKNIGYFIQPPKGNKQDG